MTPEIALTLGVIVLSLVLLAREWMPPDLLLLTALGVLVAARVIDVERALRGFSEPTLLALGSLFIVASGLRSTGVLRRVAHLLFGAGESLRGVLLRLTAATAASSAFLNNTPIVAMGIPAVLSWSRDRDQPASKLLMPLSFASIFGGVCTLIGTSTNLVANGMLRAEGLPGLGFFELGAVGLPMAVLGVAYLVLVAPRLLPERTRVGTESSEGTVASDIHVVRVPERSPVVGSRVGDVGLGMPDVQLVRIVREDGRLVSVSPAAPLRSGDQLTFRGDPSDMVDTLRDYSLEGVDVASLPQLTGEAQLREAVVAEGSELVGDRVESSEFSDRYAAALLGIVRGGKQLKETEKVRLRAGDVLLLVAPPEFDRNFADSHHLHLLGGEEMESKALSNVPIWRPTRAKWGLAILAGIVGLGTFGIVHISVAALGGAIVMIAAGYVTPGEARRAIDWSVLIVIGAAIGLGAALQDSGAATWVAEAVVAVGVPLGPRGVLATLLASTMLFTLSVTNNAAVAMLFPVATAVAASQGMDPRPLVVGVTVGASLAFATPLGYQTNLMVYGPGGYSFGDFVRVGVPLQLLVGGLAVLLIPWIWPF